MMYTQQKARLLLFTVMTAMSNVHADVTCQDCGCNVTGDKYCCKLWWEYDMGKEEYYLWDEEMMSGYMYDEYECTSDRCGSMYSQYCGEGTAWDGQLCSALAPPDNSIGAPTNTNDNSIGAPTNTTLMLACGEGTAWNGTVCMCESALAPADNSIGAPETGLMLEDPNAKIWFGSGAATCSLGLDATKSALVASCPIVGSSSAGSGRRMAQMEADNEALAKKYEALGTEKEAQYKAYKALAYKYEALGAENKALAYKYEARRAEEEAQYKALAKKIEALAAENAALKA